MAKIISIVNNKGGVGKTTTTASLGASLALMGQRTLLIDMDAQRNLTSSLTARQVQRTIYEALLQGGPLPFFPIAKNLFLCPSSHDMMGAEIQLAGRRNRDRLLEALIRPVEASFDIILIDCPPSLGIVTLAALTASDHLIVPMTAEALPTEGLAMLFNFLEQIRKTGKDGVDLLGILFTRWMNRRLNKEVEQSVRKAFPGKVFETRIRENIQVAQAPLSKQSLIDYAPNSAGAMDYQALAKEVIIALRQ